MVDTERTPRKSVTLKKDPRADKTIASGRQLPTNSSTRGASMLIGTIHVPGPSNLKRHRTGTSQEIPKRSTTVITKRQGLVSTFASVSLVGLALLVGVIWFLGTPGPVYACKCVVPGTPSEELEKFSAVFAGRVVSVQHSFDPDAGSVVREAEDRTTVGFEVSAVWKGTVHEDMYITTPPTGGSCGFTFVEGEEYIVYGYDSNYDDGGYTVGICSRTALLWQAQADLEAFGEGQAPLVGTGGPAPEQPQVTAGDVELPNTGDYKPPIWTVTLLAGIGAAATVLGLGLLVRGRRLSRRGTTSVS